MKKGISSKSGKYGYIDRHHLLTKKHRKTRKDGKRIKLSPNEHREIHHILDGVKSRDGILGLTIIWLENFKKFKC